MKNKKGFTLIEMLTVVIIMGILATMIVPSYKTSIMKTKIVNNLPLLRALQNDMINYYNLHGSLPTKLVQLSINKGEFTNIQNTSAKHVATNCTIKLIRSDQSAPYTTIRMTCGQDWLIDYTVKMGTSGYYVPDIRKIVITSSNPNSSHPVHKIATSLGWEQASGTNGTYFIR